MNDTVSTTDAAIDQRLVTTPLNWLARELERLRRCTLVLDNVATARVFDAIAVAEVIHCLRSEMPQQFADEAVDLLPLLKLRARRGDDLNGIIMRLTDGHHAMATLARQVLPRLEALKVVEEPARSDPWLAETLTVLAARQRAHLAMVGAVILPIARLRLRPRDLKALGHDLAARRSQARL